eukprot:206979-Rhodomonas_salina.2
MKWNDTQGSLGCTGFVKASRGSVPPVSASFEAGPSTTYLCADPGFQALKKFILLFFVCLREEAKSVAVGLRQTDERLRAPCTVRTGHFEPQGQEDGAIYLAHLLGDAGVHAEFRDNLGMQSDTLQNRAWSVSLAERPFNTVPVSKWSRALGMRILSNLLLQCVRPHPLASCRKLTSRKDNNDLFPQSHTQTAQNFRRHWDTPAPSL